MKKFALYGRFSSDVQNPKSVADQFFECEKYVAAAAGVVVARYSDHAISGWSRLLRKDFLQMLDDAATGGFNYVLAESIDRLARDQEDIAHLYKRLKYCGVTLMTLQDGEINEMHIGWKGTMSALQLEEISRKTRRGHEAALRAGKNPGSKPYGYDVVRELTPDNQLTTGILKINSAEAVIVHRIFEEFAEGRSARQIANGLNEDGLLGPNGRKWSQSTIRGDRKTGAGILSHHLYIGLHYYNRKTYIKNPETGKKVARMNPEEKWIITPMPHLRIISDNLWASVQAVQQAISEKPTSQLISNSLSGRRRNHYLLSGLLFCGECGKPYSLGSKERYNCSSYKTGQGCKNGRSIRRKIVETEVLDVLSKELLQPALFDDVLNEYRAWSERAIKESQEAQDLARVELRAVEKRIQAVMNAIEQGVITSGTLQRLQELEARRTEIQASISEPPKLTPVRQDILEEYHHLVADLSGALDDKKIKQAAMNAIRPLIEKIVLHPAGKGLRAEFFGNLSGLISLHIGDGGQFFMPMSQNSACLGSQWGRYLTPKAIEVNFPHWQHMSKIQKNEHLEKIG